MAAIVRQTSCETWEARFQKVIFEVGFQIKVVHYLSLIWSSYKQIRALTNCFEVNVIAAYKANKGIWMTIKHPHCEWVTKFQMIDWCLFPTMVSIQFLAGPLSITDIEYLCNTESKLCPIMTWVCLSGSSLYHCSVVSWHLKEQLSEHSNQSQGRLAMIGKGMKRGKYF